MDVPYFAARRLGGDRWEIVAPNDAPFGPSWRRVAIVSRSGKYLGPSSSHYKNRVSKKPGIKSLKDQGIDSQRAPALRSSTTLTAITTASSDGVSVNIAVMSPRNASR
jgi:hypothetical protein